MSSGLGEWEKGIPCMLHRSWLQACGDGHLGLLGALQSEPSSSGCGGGGVGTVALVYQAHFNLGSLGKSEPGPALCPAGWETS